MKERNKELRAPCCGWVAVRLIYLYRAFCMFKELHASFACFFFAHTLGNAQIHCIKNPAFRDNILLQWTRDKRAVWS